MPKSNNSVVVRWEIDIEDPKSPLDAARRAWEAMRKSDSIANVFDVVNPETGVTVRVDLEEE
jgi:hypothetical protein